MPTFKKKLKKNQYINDDGDKVTVGRKITRGANVKRTISTRPTFQPTENVVNQVINREFNEILHQYRTTGHLTRKNLKRLIGDIN